MKRTLIISAAATALVLGLTAAAPASPSGSSSPLGSLEQAAAQASKSRGAGAGGGGDAARVGDRAAELGSGWAIPLTIFIAGVLLTVALVSRNIGGAVGVVLVAVIALIFFGDPNSISEFARSVGNTIF
jgi:uncharacterized low-complexity protein